jgi:CzcA family heavy metal efflux pump
MMRKIVSASLRYRFIVIGVAVAMLLVGAAQMGAMPVDVFPEFAPPRVEIQTMATGLSAVEVEQFVTVPLEQALNGVMGLEHTRSKSVSGLSSIVLIFKADTDLMVDRQMVAERLAIVTPTLPTWAAPPVMLQPLSSTSRVMKIGLTTDTIPLTELSSIAYWTIRTRLLSVRGVANVAIWGERLQQVQVQIEPSKLALHGITVNQVMEATSESVDSGILMYSSGHGIGTGGVISSYNQSLPVQHIQPVMGPADLGGVTITGTDGEAVPLRDLAVLVEDHQPLLGEAVVNDVPGLLLIVEKFPWANTLEVTRGVEAAFRELGPGLKGVTVALNIFRPADFIEVALDNLAMALLIGSLLVLVILSLFLFEWRTAVISLVAIPLSLTAAGLVLYLRGGTINTMVLAGLVIAVGVVVDDAIIDVENIARRLRLARRSGSGQSTSSIIVEASLEVRSAIVYATLIILVSVVPVLFIGGVAGAFFQPLVLSYALAVFASMLVALTVTPALAYILLRKAPERRESPLASVLKRGYTAVLGRIVRAARPAMGAVAVVAALGLIVAPRLGQDLFPTFKERDFLMHWMTKPGTSLAEERRITESVSKELRAIPGVMAFGSHIGTAYLGEEVAGVDFGENWVSIDPKVDYDKTRAAIQAVVDGYPGLNTDLQTYLKERISEVLSGTGDSIVIRIYGPDLYELRRKANEVEKVVAGVAGVKEAHSELQVDVPQVQVTMDMAAAERYGVKPGDVRRDLATIIAGEEVGDIFHGGKAYDVMVWTVPAGRANPQQIAAQLIDTPSGQKVPLSQLATVRFAPTPNTISRDALSRKIDVAANVEGRDLGAVVGDIQARLTAVQMGDGYHMELLGEYQERSAAEQSLLLFGLGAVIGIFLLLQASFGSSRLALLSLTTLSSALAGGVLAAWLSGGVISLGSLVGFLTVLGIDARSGIMMINHFQHLEREEGEAFGPALVVRGARERLSPILMTALATGLALVPLAVTGDLPGHEIEHPMAIVILGGLITSTLINLFVTPSLYLRFARPAQRVDAPVLSPVAA